MNGIFPATILRDMSNAPNPIQPLASSASRYLGCTKVKGGQVVVLGVGHAILWCDSPAQGFVDAGLS